MQPSGVRDIPFGKDLYILAFDGGVVFAGLSSKSFCRIVLITGFCISPDLIVSAMNWSP